MTSTATLNERRKPRQFSVITNDVKDRVAGQWRDVLATEGGIPAESLDGSHHPCPKCGGDDRFRMIDANAGAVLCNQCFDRDNGDGFAALQWLLGCDFKAVVFRLAERFNIPTDEPSKKSGPAFERIRDELQDDVIAVYCRKKPPQTVDAVKAAGGFAVNWPIGFQGDQRCIAFPAVNDCGKVTGHILRRVMGNDFAAYKKTAASKTRMIKGSKDGLVIPGGWERVKAVAVVWKVEGVPDAVTLFSHLPDDHAVITNICGAKAVPPYLDPLAGKIVYVIGDADQPGQDGAARWANKLEGIAAEVRVVNLPFDLTDDSGKDLRDLFLDGGTFADLLKLAEAAPVWTPTEEPQTTKANGKDNRTPIELTTKEFDINNQVIEALRADADLYQRGGQLVTVLYGPKSEDDKIKRQPEAPRIEPLSAPTVREKISQHVRFYIEAETDDGIQEKDKFVPDWNVKAVHARGQWDGIRPLTGVVNHPVLTPDGSILTTPGYDPQTRLILDWRDEPLVIPDRPSRGDAVAAVGRLKNIVSDFPFETQAQLAGWLAFLLTVLVRYAFHQAITSPLFLFDANVRGSGKSMLADLVGLIVCGFELARMVLPKDDDEMRKSLLSIAMAGDEIVLLDNVSGELGGQSLDAVLTGKRINGRLLGATKQLSIPINSVWAATSNNASIVGDLCRRTIHIRLASPLEKPEERTDFAIPDLVGHVRQHRRELLTDLCVILRAYIVAGRPVRELTPMGSFEEWSSIVRQTLVWLGESDPWDTRVEFAKRADTGAQTLAELLRLWPTIDPTMEGATASELLQRLQPLTGPLNVSEQLAESERLKTVTDFKAIVCELCGCKPNSLPSSKTLGKRLGSMRDRVYQGQRLVSQPNRKEVMVWRVETVDRQVPGLPGVAGFPDTLPTRVAGILSSHNGDDKKENITGNRPSETRQHPANPADVAESPPDPPVPDAVADVDRPRQVRHDQPKFPPWDSRSEEQGAA